MTRAMSLLRNVAALRVWLVAGARRLALCGAFALAILLQGSATAAEPTEYQVKAVFIFNFSHFVEWPAQAFTAPAEPFVVGILGGDPFGERLDEVVLNEHVAEHPIVVRRFHNIDEIGNCQILFIDRSEGAQLGHILAALNGRSILTVSELDGAAQRGAMIQFVKDNNRIRLRINAEAARSAGLVISSKLLRLAEVVSTSVGD
jgi:hypothetical protein